MKLLRVMLMVCHSSICCASLFADESKVSDEALLEDLGAELLRPSNERSPTALDQRLLDRLGEDIGQQDSAEDDWLASVVTHMKAAQEILETSDESTRASSAQSEALSGLDAMIAELTARQSQCKGGNCNKPSPPKPGKKPSSDGKAGQSPAQSANSTTNSDADLSTDLAVAGELVQDLWGKLPERQRQQILQPLSEEFLPKYATEIEAYFRALAKPKNKAAETR